MACSSCCWAFKTTHRGKKEEKKKNLKTHGKSLSFEGYVIYHVLNINFYKKVFCKRVGKCLMLFSVLLWQDNLVYSFLWTCLITGVMLLLVMVLRLMEEAEVRINFLGVAYLPYYWCMVGRCDLQFLRYCLKPTLIKKANIS